MSNLKVPMVLSIPLRGVHFVKDAAQASADYATARDISGEGSSTFPDGVVLRGSIQIGRVSYNGCVWSGPKFDRLIFDPSGQREIDACDVEAFDPTDKRLNPSPQPRVDMRRAIEQEIPTP